MSIESGASSIAIFDQIFNEKQIQTINHKFFLSNIKMSWRFSRQSQNIYALNRLCYGMGMTALKCYTQNSTVNIGHISTFETKRNEMKTETILWEHSEIYMFMLYNIGLLFFSNYSIKNYNFKIFVIKMCKHLSYFPLPHRMVFFSSLLIVNSIICSI